MEPGPTCRLTTLCDWDAVRAAVEGKSHPVFGWLTCTRTEVSAAGPGGAAVVAVYEEV